MSGSGFGNDLGFVAWCVTASASLIFSLFTVIHLMNRLIYLIGKTERLRDLAVALLNFDSKPHLAAAVIIIAVFSIVYWPAAMLLHFI